MTTHPTDHAPDPGVATGARPPRAATALVDGPDAGHALAWQRGLDVLRSTDLHWLTTVRRAGGAPRTRPVLSVVVDDAVFTASSPAAHKALDLAADRRCSLASRDAGLDLVIEATASRVDDAELLVEVAATYRERYGWTVEIHRGAFHAEGAPTAGPPPYHVYRLEPVVAYGFGTDDAHAPRSTRWTF